MMTGSQLRAMMTEYNQHQSVSQGVFELTHCMLVYTMSRKLIISMQTIGSVLQVIRSEHSICLTYLFHIDILQNLIEHIC